MSDDTDRRIPYADSGPLPPDPVGWPSDDMPLSDQLRYAAEYVAQFDGCWLGHGDCLRLIALLNRASVIMATNPARPKLVDALKQRVPFAQQDPDEQFYPARCSDDVHHWHENADAEGDTCNCGAWYRFADRIERTPV